MWKRVEKFAKSDLPQINLPTGIGYFSGSSGIPTWLALMLEGRGFILDEESDIKCVAYKDDTGFDGYLFSQWQDGEQPDVTIKKFQLPQLEPVPPPPPKALESIRRAERLERVQALIVEVCNDLCQMLLGKNKAYGNSALDPVRIFSKADPLEQLNVRMDDKLSRIEHGEVDYMKENPEWDIAGYLVLKEVARRLNSEEKK